jgi:hypothetical protein
MSIIRVILNITTKFRPANVFIIVDLYRYLKEIADALL